MKKYNLNKTINFLISGPSGDVGNSIIRILNKIKIKKKIFIIGNTKLNTKRNFHLSPSVKDNLKYKNFVKNFIIKNKIDFFFPCINEEQNLYDTKKIGNCDIVINNNKKIKFFSNKLKLQQFLKKNKFNYISSFAATKKNILKINPPFVFKPIFGKGSQGMKIIFNNSGKNKILPNNDYLIQSYIKDKKDYTAFFLREKNNILTMSVFERILKNGSTIYAKLIKWDDSIVHLNYFKFLKKVALKTGLNFSNIQFKIKNKKIHIYEINTRFSGTIYLHCLIFNIPLYLISKKIFGENILEKRMLSKLVATRKRNWKIVSYE